MKIPFLQFYEVCHNIGTFILIFYSLRRQPLILVLFGIYTTNLNNCCTELFNVVAQKWKS